MAATVADGAKKRKDKARSPSPYRSREGQTTAEFVNEFWQHTITTAENSSDDFKHQALPLARIKKVMKSDPAVQQMISSEVTVLFEKACQIFIQELAARSHMVSLSSRRRTLSRPDVAQAIAKSDMFDFLIDIVPREEIPPSAPAASTSASHTASPRNGGAGGAGGGSGAGGSKKSSGALPTRGSRRTRGRRTRQVPNGGDEDGDEEPEQEQEEDGEEYDADAGDEYVEGGRQSKRRRTQDEPVSVPAYEDSTGELAYEEGDPALGWGHEAFDYESGGTFYQPEDDNEV